MSIQSEVRELLELYPQLESDELITDEGVDRTVDLERIIASRIEEATEGELVKLLRVMPKYQLVVMADTVQSEALARILEKGIESASDPVNEPKPKAADSEAGCPEIILYNKPDDTTQFHNRSLMIIKAPESLSTDDIIQFADRSYPTGTVVGWTTGNHEGIERFRASDSLGENQHFVILIG